MATDVRLDERDGSFLVLDARVVHAASSDFMLDSPERRNGGGPFRRALVHNQADGLTINFNGDYPGGVGINGVTELVPLRPAGLPVRQLPMLAVRGSISYETGGITAQGAPTRVTVSLDGELNKLAAQIAALAARVQALEAR